MATLRVDGGPSFAGELEHWHYDTFRADWQDAVLGTTLMTFSLDARGNVDVLHVEGFADFERKDEPEKAAGQAEAR